MTLKTFYNVICVITYPDLIITDYDDGSRKYVYSNGDNYWTKTITYPDGSVDYYKHNLDGPAVELTENNIKEWYCNGIKMPCSSQEEFEMLLKLKAFW